MYGVLTAITPGCVAFSLPVQRRNFRTQEVSAFFRSLHSLRSARLTRSGGFEPERRSVQVRTCPLADTTEPIIAAARLDRPRPASALAPRRAFSDRQAASFAAPNYSDGPTLNAPDCVAGTPGTNIADARRKPRTPLSVPGNMFGKALQLAFRPSPHPRIRWTVASTDSASRAPGSMRPPPSRVPKCPTRC